MNLIDKILLDTFRIEDPQSADKLITMIEYESMVPNKAAKRKAEIFDARIIKAECGYTLRPMTKEEEEEMKKLNQEELEYYEKRNNFLREGGLVEE